MPQNLKDNFHIERRGTEGLKGPYISTETAAIGSQEEGMTGDRELAR